MIVRNTTEQKGFALLMALVVVSVVVSVGLSVLELTIKQVRLSTNSRDSETAFHAANAGIECARYWREANSDALEAGTAVQFNCFGVAVTPSVSTLPASNGGTAYFYRTPVGSNQITWGGTGAPRCTEIRVLVMNSTPTQPSVTPSLITGSSPYFEGYPYNNGIKTCTAGGRCTVISSRGYSKACAAVGTTGTVQREVLLEL